MNATNKKKNQKKKKVKKISKTRKLFYFVSGLNTSDLAVVACMLLFVVFELQFFSVADKLPTFSYAAQRSSASEIVHDHAGHTDAEDLVVWRVNNGVRKRGEVQQVSWTDYSDGNGKLYLVSDSGKATLLTTQEYIAGLNHLQVVTYNWKVNVPAGKYQFLVKNTENLSATTDWFEVK
ncbi:MAG TPA: hypothetical protein VEA59_07095 [Patescibacteria group bacterium]|nr:hypothetical protein [Patescibacteria group bacterium]